MEETVEIKTTKEVTLDGFENMLNSLGKMGIDPSASYTFEGEDLLDENTINSMYNDDGVCTRIVRCIVEDSLRKWFIISGDDDRVIQNFFETIRFKVFLQDFLEWARAFGGAVMFLGLDDGEKDPISPVNFAKLKNIKFIRVFDRNRIQSISVSQDIQSERYLLPDTYTIAPVNGSPFPCHYSRLIIQDGQRCSDMTRINNNGWGLSVYQGVMSKMSLLGGSFNSVASILNTFVNDVIHIDGLHAMVVAGKEGAIIKRISMIDMSRSAIGTTLLDKTETFERHIASISGMSDILDRFMLYICACTGIPATKLWGRSPAGLNATGESDISNWYDDVDSYRTDTVAPVIERMCEIIFSCSELTNSEPKEWKVVFPPLRQLSSSELSTLYKTNSEADDINIKNGSLSSVAVAQHRFSGVDYNMENPSNIETDNPPNGGD